MQIYFGQIYIDPSASLKFTHYFQKYLGSIVTTNIESSKLFVDKYDLEYSLIFRISAKCNISDNEITGPNVFKKDKDIEYTIFLPFDVIGNDFNLYKSALNYLFKGIYQVFESLKMDVSILKAQEEQIIQNVLKDPKMIAASTA